MAFVVRSGADNPQYKHGMIGTPTYKAWRGVIDRCCRPKNKQYYLYGGKGITIPPHWKDFDGFFADMGERPEGYWLVRVDLNKNYSKENCKWDMPYSAKPRPPADDILGKTFGKWTVIKLESSGKGRTSRKYLCKCTCGTEDILISNSLRHGKTTQCIKCVAAIKGAACSAKTWEGVDPMVGKSFGSWFVIKRIESLDDAPRWYLCRCACGKESNLRGAPLKLGKSRSCRSCALRRRAQ